MTLPRRSFLKSIAAALAGATAVRSAVTPVAEAAEPLAEFPKKGPRIHSALLEDNLVDVQHDMMARLGREWAERVDRDCWRRLRHKAATLPEGWNVHHFPPLKIDRADGHIYTTNLVAVPPDAHRQIHDLISHPSPYHNIAFGRSY